MNERLLKALSDHSCSLQNSLNIELSDIAKSDFQKLIQDSVNRIVKENRVSETDLNKAKDAFSTFIFKMYPLSESRTGQKGIVSYQALNEAKSSIYPLWPIC